MKTCRWCGASKNIDDFYRDSASRDGRRPECKSCTSARRRRWYEANREREIDRVKRWQDENRERHLTNQRRRRQRPDVKARERDGYLRRKYGITLAEYDAMLDAQGGVCAICGRPPRDDISLHVDHDHESGRRRKLLCFKCNNALGDFVDDPDLLRAAIDYLDSHDPEVAELTRQVKARLAALRN